MNDNKLLRLCQKQNKDLRILMNRIDYLEICIIFFPYGIKMVDRNLYI